MQIISNPSDFPVPSGSRGFVPTMGALHEGHVSLVRKSIQENEQTVVSIYLNPTQFNNAQDLDSYPSSLEADIKILEDLNVDILFLPDYKAIYPKDFRYKVIEEEVTKTLCGAARPGHFTGVLTVVLKLLNIVQANNAYFGEKDFQQYLLIKDMAEAFFLKTQIVPCPLIREEDGLAMSSRNRRLSPEGRKKAPRFYQVLKTLEPEEVLKKNLEAEGFEIDYVTYQHGRLFAAVWLEEVRLIDNVSAQ